MGELDLLNIEKHCIFSDLDEEEGEENERRYYKPSIRESNAQEELKEDSVSENSQPKTQRTLNKSKEHISEPLE